jgi:hypothetical protein
VASTLFFRFLIIGLAELRFWPWASKRGASAWRTRCSLQTDTCGFKIFNVAFFTQQAGLGERHEFQPCALISKEISVKEHF